MHHLKQLVLAAGDFLCLSVGLLISLFVRYQIKSPETIILGQMTRLYLISIVIMFVIGLYDIGRLKNSWNFFQKIIITAILWAFISVTYFYLRSSATINPKTILVLNTVIGFGLIALWRYLYNLRLSTVIFKTKVVFIGSHPEALEVIKIINNQPQRGYVILGVMNNGSLINNSLPVINNLEDLTVLKPDIIVVCSMKENDPEMYRVLYQKLTERVQIVDLAKFYEDIMSRVPPFTFSENWFITHLQEQDKKNYDRVRFLVDWAAAVAMGIFFLATYPVIALLIKLTSPGPVFFKQIRIGRDGKPFTVVKYRTMKALAQDGSAEISGPQFASANDDRITKAGKILRCTRLDEIPQFINILKNQMALIGPRPERPEFVEELTKKMPFYQLRHLVKPGLTGWAQLFADYYGTIDENLRKLEYDLYYIKNRGPLLDIPIVLRTINVILGMRGR